MFALKLEVNEYPAVILIVLFHAVIQFFDMPLIGKAQNLLFELPAAFAGDDFNERDLLVHGFFYDTVEFRVDLIAFVVNIVQVEFKFCHVYFPQG